MLALILLFVFCSALPTQDGKIRLGLRGDDFGHTHASNVAMDEAFRRGFMSSGSLLVPGPWFAETATMVKAIPDWSVGVHLTITTEGRPYNVATGITGPMGVDLP